MRFLLFFVLLDAGLNAQQLFLGHAIQFTPEDAPVKNFNLLKYRISLLGKYGPIIKDEIELHDFVESVTELKRDYLTSNAEYEQWDSANIYMHKILAELSFDATPDFKPDIKIVRDPSANACSFEDGTVYINVGLIARFDTEAEIAAILGHEIGHILKGHAYKNYVIRQEHFKAMGRNVAYSKNPAMGMLIASTFYSNKLKSNEKESDAVSLEALKKSGYNSVALSHVFKRFVEIEEKYKARTNNNNRFSFYYLKTHPNPANRLKKSLQAEAHPGKNFIVDSVYFTRLKKQCIDETINLWFENLHFNECNEMAFVAHLKTPNDPFYLFYLTESTRRLVETNQELSEENFITYPYKQSFGLDNIIVPKPFVKTGGLVKPHDKKFLASVFYRLNGPLLNTDSTDLVAFTNTALTRSDTIPFLTNADALAYFKQQNTDKSFLLNNVFFYGPVEDSLNLSEKEKQFNNLPLLCEDYKNQQTNDRVLWVLLNVSRVRMEKGFLEGNFIAETIDPKIVYDNIKPMGVFNYVDTRDNLNFKENNRIDVNIVRTIQPLFQMPKESRWTNYSRRGLLNQPQSTNYVNLNEMTDRQPVYLNAGRLMPELVSILKKYNYKGIMFSTLSISEEAQSALGQQALRETWKVHHYYIDAKNNESVFSYTKISNQNSSGFINMQNNTEEDLYGLYYQTLLNACK